MRKKVIGALLIIVFISMSFSLISLSALVNGNAQVTQLAQVASINSSGIGSQSNQVSSITSGFYDGLGTIYTVQTLDGVNIKVLRYHPIGQNFNNGSQPILLLPGIVANINEFLSHTTPRVAQLYPNITLPANLSSWAVGDPNIQKDPLLYYSPAYFLWKQGYDVWLANYRGTGFGDMKSGMGNSNTTLDDWALLDARAALNFVYSMTLQHPVVGGHSTGGLSTMMLLQGAYIQSNGMVASNETLAKERNGIIQGPETIKAYIALEPAGIPVISSSEESTLGWLMLSANVYLDLRSIIQALDGTGNLSLIALDSNLMSLLGQTPLKDLVTNIMNLDPTDFTPALGYYQTLYCLDSTYLSCLAQYSDFAFEHTIREFYRDGASNQYVIVPSQPHNGDGYYYFVDTPWSTNMKKMSVPMITIFASMQNNYNDLVNSTEIIQDFINAKTATPYDAYYIIPGTAHIDCPIGNHAPTDIFPILSSWLAVVAPP